MNKMDDAAYRQYAEARSPRSPLAKNCLFAFLFGGGICTIGQGLHDLYGWLNLSADNVKTMVPATLIALAAILTGLNIFDKIAKIAGAGTLVPITGFANALVSPAIDTKAEGFILGVGAKIFTVAGPVILYGTLASAVYGLILWLVGQF